MKWNLFLGSLIFWQVLLPYFQLLTEMLYAIHYTLNTESHKDLFSCVYENCNCEFKWRIFHEFCLGLWTWIFDCWMHDTQWFEKSHKKSHLTLRAKRAVFTFWIDKSWLKMPKIVNLLTFWNPKTCSQTVLPDIQTHKHKIGQF